jgi:predicted AAA+ superfamily ATPase
LKFFPCREERYECDFIVKKGNTVSEAIQVTYSLADEKTKKREIRGLVEACKLFGLTSGIIITPDVMEELVVDTIKLRSVPLSDWLLSNDFEE